MRSRTHHGSQAFARRKDASLVVIGNFDGVHRGHRAVIETALNAAAAQHLTPLVLTFHPHPAEVLGRGVRPVLTTLERKIELLLRVGEALEVVVEPFTIALSQLTPLEFARDVLVHQLHARMVIVGENFRFGYQREGDLAKLRELGIALGFDAHVEPLVGDDEGLFSSTRARAALEAGDLARVERCLGRPHSLSGTVIAGNQRGRSLGFPTANLGVVEEALPPYGVYACLVDRKESDGWRVLGRGVMNLGLRPTVQAGFSAEAYVLDWSGDLYGAELRVHLVSRIREERRFDGIDALRAQIAADVATARERLAGARPDGAAHGAWV